MTDKKATTHRKVPAITEAPEPPSPIRGRGYQQKRDQTADFKHWNRMPVIGLWQAIMLTLDIDPRTKIQEPSNRQRYEQLQQVALSHRQAGTLPVFAHDPSLMRSDDWLQWVRSNSDEEPPKEWQPIAASQPEASVPKSSEVHSRWTIESAIADDLFIRIDASEHSREDKKYGLQRIYNFLIREDRDSCRPLRDYGLDLYRYWLVDDIKDERTDPYEVGAKGRLRHIRIVYEEHEDSEPQNFTFKQLMETFTEIKNLRLDNSIGK